MQNFRNLRVWEKSHRLTLDVYASSKNLHSPGYEQLTMQVIEIKRMLSSLMQKVKAVN